MQKYKEIVMYSPAVSSVNMGDHIIYEGVCKQLKGLLEDAFIIEISTHLPVSKYIKTLSKADYKFVCGSNLLRGKMDRCFRQWDIDIFHADKIGPAILVGAGWWQYGDEPNLYTKNLYKRVLSDEYYHSVRDSYTEKQLKKIGIENVINTSCPTMWDLTKEHCLDIPKSKAKNVVTTVTDYRKDIDKDSKMLNILFKNYEKVYLWLQGMGDYQYIKNLNIDEKKVTLVPPNLESYNNILNEDVDYIGTRLHAGIRALQMKKRSIIIGIDNRSIEKKKDFNLVVVNREEIDKLEDFINCEFPTEINIPIDNINKWKSQFDLKIN